jgi:trimeric autotransporter adhesin
VDRSGNLFILDKFNYRVRKVAAGSGMISTVAGNGFYAFGGDGGAASSSRLMDPEGVAVDAAGNIFIADFSDPSLRKVAAGTGVITDMGVIVRSSPSLAADSSGNLFISIQGSIWKMDKIGARSFVAGNGSSAFSGDGGPATAAGLTVRDMAVDSSGNLFVADYLNKRIRKVAAGTGVITTVAGNGTPGFSGDGGPATAASLGTPVSVAVDPAGNLFIAIADTTNIYSSVGTRIRRVSATTGIITTVAGDGSYNYSGDGSAAASTSVYGVTKLAVDKSGNVYLSTYKPDSPLAFVRVLKPAGRRL